MNSAKPGFQALRANPLSQWALRAHVSRLKGIFTVPRLRRDYRSFYSSPNLNGRTSGVPHFLRKKTPSDTSARDNLDSSTIRSSPRLRSQKQCQVIFEDPTESLSTQVSQQTIDTFAYNRNMKANVTILTTPTVDTSGTSLLLHFDDKRYLIGNIHEGMQRICVQSGTRLSRLNDLWVSGRTEWKNVGGMCGMLLTLADAVGTTLEAAKSAMRKSRGDLARKKLSGQVAKDVQQALQRREAFLSTLGPQNVMIHGGSNLMQTLAAARKFIFRKGVPTVVNEYDSQNRKPDDKLEPTWMDHNIRVWAIPVAPEAPPGQTTTSGAIDGNPMSPLKRSFNDYSETPSNAEVSSAVDRGTNDITEEQRLQLLKGIVSDMFDSDWRLDALFETPLPEVKMPATIFIRNPDTHVIEKYQGPLPGGAEPLPNVTVLVRKPWPGALVSELPRTKPSDISMSYIFRNQPQRGKFNPKAAVSLGVPPGPDFARLTEGNSVQNDKGETVYPEQVLGKTKPGGGFALIDLPSVEYVAGLVSRPEWDAQEVMLGVEAIVWNLGSGVADDTRLQDFIQKLHGFKHVISSPDYCANYLAMKSASAAAIRHSQLDAERFSIPLHDNRTRALPESLSHCTIAHRGINIQLEPEVVIRTPQVPDLLNTAEVLNSTPKKVLRLAAKARYKIESEANSAKMEQESLLCPDAEIIPLGTGSALPSKYRNVSSTLVRIPGVGSYLFDCGENTFGQLSRLYSAQELKNVLQDLKLIWISHMHADHHLGTASVIREWYKEVYGGVANSKVESESLSNDLPTRIKDQKSLFVVAEPAMGQWLREYSQVEEFGYERLIVLDVRGATSEKPMQLLWEGTPVGFSTDNPAINRALQDATGILDLQSVNVAHCYGAKAVAITFPNGFKVSYSGDCRPSRAFTEIGKGSTVLIHEATFDDELKGDAAAKNHSTVSEAIGVGYAMGARRILLTHFSQRYQKIPKTPEIDKWKLQFHDPASKDEVESADHPVVDLTNATTDERTPDIPNNYEGESRSNTASRKQSVSVQSLSQKAKDTKVAIAFDLMRIKVKDFGIQEQFIPAFVRLYGDPTLNDDFTDAEFLKPSPEQEAAREKQKAEKKAAKKAKLKENKKLAAQLGLVLDEKPQKPQKSDASADGSSSSSGEGVAQSSLTKSNAAAASSGDVIMQGAKPLRAKQEERRLGGGQAEDPISSSEDGGKRFAANKKRKTQERKGRDPFREAEGVIGEGKKGHSYLTDDRN